MINTHSKGIAVFGTACADQIFKVGPLEPNGKTDQIAPVQIRAGGSAVNISWAITTIANALETNIPVSRCLRLGITDDNPGKDIILRELGYPTLADKSIMDGMYDRPYKVPYNLVIENEIGRAIARDFKRAATPHLYDGIHDDIVYALRHSAIIMGNSSPYEETEIAFHIAKNGVDDQGKRLNLLTVYDYSEKKKGDAMTKAASLLQYADVVVAPSDALLPEMNEADPEQLMSLLVEKYKRERVAISDGQKPVMIYDRGKTYSIPVVEEGEEIVVRNVNGAGDTRDAALCVSLYLGNTFEAAIRTATAMAKLYVQQPDRDTFESVLTGELDRPDRDERVEHCPAHPAAAWRSIKNPLQIVDSSHPPSPAN